jgi:hypothetical protein
MCPYHLQQASLAETKLRDNTMVEGRKQAWQAADWQSLLVGLLRALKSAGSSNQQAMQTGAVHHEHGGRPGHGGCTTTLQANGNCSKRCVPMM